MMGGRIVRIGWAASWVRGAGAAALTVGIMVAALLVTGCGVQTPRGPLAAPDYVPGGVQVAPTTIVPKAGVVEPPANGAYIGVFRPPAPFEPDSLDSYSEVSDKPPAVLMWFQPWARGGSNRFDSGAVVSTLRRGAIPLITWEPWDPGADPNLLSNPVDQPGFRLQRIADGEFDPYIRQWARGCAAVGGPIMLRPMHEMNGGWYPWGGMVNGNSPETFKAAWRRIHDVFEEEGATNVTWVWSINASAYPYTKENSPPSYYPGDEYVDWTSLSGFNWGNSRPLMRWMTFREVYGDVMPYLESVGKPIVISEFGSVEEPGDKAAWIADAYEAIRTDYPSVKAVVYYDKLEVGLKGSQEWPIASSVQSLEAYRAAVDSPYFIGGPASTLEQWAAQLDGDEWVRLSSFRRVYSGSGLAPD